MLYLEDYLEMIEHLPQELRDRFTEMREMDLQVNNTVDSLDERVKVFFSNAKKMKQSERDCEYEKIRLDYYKALEDADEKVHIANQVYDLVERYLRRLDQELQKFKMELEADNAGITEILEKRSLELDNPPPTTNSISTNYPRGEKRKHGQQNISVTYTPDKQIAAEKVFSTIATEAMRETISGSRVALPGHSPSSSSTSSSSSNSSAQERTIVLTPQTKSTFVSTNALAAAASQAIAATQQSLKRGTSQNQSNLVQQGRRTASLKASYEAVNSGQNLNKELTLGNREINSVVTAPTNIANSVTVPSEPKKVSKKARTSMVVQPVAEPSPLLEDSEDSSVLEENMFLDNYDPNEPRYCVCNQVSYGDMVACDHKDCPFEWFHYQCVGITQPPKGKWFCPQCSASMRRRNRKDK
ncbi:inhibitor of growth protein 3-like [Argiope bruennichi]|uniref:Inhibitor of growth protein n=1 Tax=Argiope bruennichi TaxID=94029 RepID=A0A8T0FDU7_ARGBR|nr:inhibitor of growth protein 3-like [Argiope bruennichi]XP_055941577.1 inhibitor of growth protein 3-like [Argiope bruennichi]XP_055941578.1 inhibitor of growth protein 3-like [Argiope bruennichi]XP_055941579.1 inhibitor of growth protein 3-like [Argiope bruennichi]KAF8787470.1 Inhibitor of growth protein 3 like protein [Argiope bruennichi]